MTTILTSSRFMVVDQIGAEAARRVNFVISGSEGFVRVSDVRGYRASTGSWRRFVGILVATSDGIACSATFRRRHMARLIAALQAAALSAWGPDWAEGLDDDDGAGSESTNLDESGRTPP